MSTRSERFVTELPSFEDVHRRILRGESASSIARTLVEEGEVELNMDAVVAHLRSYRRTLTDFELVTTAGRSDVVTRAMGAVERHMDELDELNELYRMQKERIRQGIDGESGRGDAGLDPRITQAISVAIGTVKASHAVKVSMGFHLPKEASTEMSNEVLDEMADRYGDGVAELMKTPKSRTRVLNLMQRFLAVAGMPPEESDTGGADD